MRLLNLGSGRLRGLVIFVAALALMPKNARASSYLDYAAQLAANAQAYAEAKASEAYAWASNEAEYAKTTATSTYDAAVSAVSSTYDAATAAATKVYNDAKAAAAPYTAAKPSPRPSPKPTPDVSTGCPGDPLPSEAETTQAITILEVVKMAGNVDCTKVAQVQGFATSLSPLRIPVSSMDLTPISSSNFRGCKLATDFTGAAWDIGTMPFKCAGNAGYGLFVDGAWGDADFLMSLAGMALQEGGRAALSQVPWLGEYGLHAMGMRTYDEIGEDVKKTTLATIDQASQYLGTPEGRQKLEVMMCYGMRPDFRLAADTKMLQGMSQMLVNGIPGAADKLAEIPCSEVASLGCRIGGMIGYEFVSDSLFEAAAAAATATGVGAAAGVAVGAGAIAKTLGKIAVKSAEAAVELFRFMMKLIPADLLKDIVKGLEKLVPEDLFAMIRKASGLSDEVVQDAARVASKAPAPSAMQAAARAEYDGALAAAKDVVDSGAKPGSKAFEEANGRLIDQTAKHLDAQGVRYSILEDPPGHRVIEIQPGSSGTGKQNQLNGVATGLSNVQGVSVRYDPLGMYSKGANAGFNPGHSRLYLPDEAIRDVSTTGATVRHELNHAKTTRDLRVGRENPLHGSLSSSAPGVYGNYFSHDEVAAFRVSILDPSMGTDELQAVAEQGLTLSETARDAARRSQDYLSGASGAAAPQLPISFDSNSSAPVVKIGVPADGASPAFTQSLPIVGGRSKEQMQAEMVAIVERQVVEANRRGLSSAADYQLAIDGLATGKSRIIYSLDPASGVVTGEIVFTTTAGVRTKLPVPLSSGGEAGILVRQLDSIERASADAAEVFEMNAGILDSMESVADPAQKSAMEAARRYVSRKRPAPGTPGYQPVTKALLESEYRRAYQQALKAK